MAGALISIVVLAALVVLIVVLVQLARRLLRLVSGRSETSRRCGGGARDRDVSSFGRLHTPADPVGPVGSLAPDADLSSTAGDPDRLYGDV